MNLYEIIKRMKHLICILLLIQALTACSDEMRFTVEIDSGIVRVCNDINCGVGFFVRTGEIVTTGNLLSGEMYLETDGEQTDDIEIVKTDEYNNLVLISTDAISSNHVYRICDDDAMDGDDIYTYNGIETRYGRLSLDMVIDRPEWMSTDIDAPESDEGSPIFDTMQNCVRSVGVDRMVKLCGPSTEAVRNFVR